MIYAYGSSTEHDQPGALGGAAGGHGLYRKRRLSVMLHQYESSQPQAAPLKAPSWSCSVAFKQPLLSV